MTVWVKDAILRASSGLVEKVKFQVAAIDFNWFRLACVVMPSTRAARIIVIAIELFLKTNNIT